MIRFTTNIDTLKKNYSNNKTALEFEKIFPNIRIVTPPKNDSDDNNDKVTDKSKNDDMWSGEWSSFLKSKNGNTYHYTCLQEPTEIIKLNPKIMAEMTSTPINTKKK